MFETLLSVFIIARPCAIVQLHIFEKLRTKRSDSNRGDTENKLY